MEPQSLEQLLDCPICFERLDGSNRVLPCQHTFCKKCLERVRSEFKELRCPECRTKYSGSINDLHCNILVMRILEQIKQSEKEAQKLKSTTNPAKHSNGRTKIDPKSSVRNNVVAEKRNYVKSLSVVASAFFNNPTGSHVRHRPNANRVETNAPAQQALNNNNENPSSGSRVILGAARKQNRNRDDGSKSSSMFARSLVPPSSTNIESARGKEASTFSPNSYTFTVELKSSDRNVSGSRRGNKNYVKPSVLNGIRSPGNLLDNFTATTSSIVTPSTSQSVSVFHSGPKNYLSFSPGSYTFNVNLKPNDRGVHKKKNYLS